MTSDDDRTVDPGQLPNVTDTGSNRRLPGKKLLVPAIVFVVGAVVTVAGLFLIPGGYRPPSVDRIGNTSLHLAAWRATLKRWNSC